jgi:hypothetical protein
MNKKDISYILKVAKRCDLSGDYVLADKFSKLLEKNYRYSQANELTMENFVDRLFQFVANSGLRDANGNVSFVNAFNLFSSFGGARINNVSISMIPELVNLRNIVGSNPGKVYMPNDLRNMLLGGASSNSGNANNNNARNNAGNNNQNNNLLVSNSPMDFAVKLFQFARNNNFSNLTRAYEYYMNNAFYNGVKISNNQPFNQLYQRIRATNSVINESMVAGELTMILGGGYSRPDSNEPQNDEQAAERDPAMKAQRQQEENNYQSNETFKEYAELIENEPANGLESLRDDINRNSYLSQEDKNRLIKYLDAMKAYRGVK